MEGKNILIGVLVFVIAAILWNQGIIGGTSTPATPPTGGQNQPSAPSVGKVICPTDPQVQLGLNKKEDSGQTNWGTWKYKLNGGTTQTDADGTLTVINEVPNNYLFVLAGDGNSSAVYRYLWNPPVSVCGVNPIAYNEMTPYQTYDTKCFNDDGDPMNYTNDGRISNNQTVGLGGGMTVHCVLTKVAKTGMPDLNGDGQAGVLFLEMNGSTWKENNVAVKWDNVQLSRDSAYNAFDSSLSTSVVEEFKVPAFSGSGTIDFYITADAETNVNPAKGDALTPATYQDGVMGYLIPENCYEEEDVSPSVFKCGMEDMDSDFMSPGGTTKSTASITQFLIGVD